MNPYFSKIRKPIKRQNAENYLLLTLFSFAASVTLTRLYLEIAGYPTIGSGNLHIAHVLWGGLLLFIAALLPIIFANRWVYVMSALLAGTGVGLFIDEVGKFITQNNDYFYPPAAPIIYAFFLLTVLVYLQVRRSPPKDPRSEFYHVLDALEEVLDHDLDSKELIDLSNRLEFISKQDDYPHLRLLAKKILDFLSSKELMVVPYHQGWRGKYLQFSSWIRSTIAEEKRHRVIITGGMLALGFVSIYRVIQLLFTYLVNNITGSTIIYWFVLRLLLEAFFGILLLVAVYMILRHKTNIGIQLGYYGLLGSLTIVNLVIFYFDQFSTILPATIQFLLFIGLISYKRNYLRSSGEN